MPPCWMTAMGSDHMEWRERVKDQEEARKSREPGHLSLLTGGLTILRPELD